MGTATKVWAACASGFLALGSWACESDYNVNSGDGTGGTGGSHPDIEVSPGALDFGEVLAGESQSRPVTVKNVGSDTLQLRAFEVDGPDSFAALDDGLDRLLAPGEQIELQVVYAPFTSEAAAGTLVVESNDPDEERVPVALSAVGLAPRIEISPQTWDMGDWEIGCGTATTLSVRNSGSADLSIHAVSFEPTSEEFTFLDPGLVGRTLAPGETVDATVRYAPADTLEDAAFLYVESDDPATPRALATQTATGHLAQRVVDTFIQEGNNWTDILWVVDNSCSMVEEQGSMAANFSAFMGIVEGADVDFHIAVVTTDNASFRVGEGVKVIDPTTVDPESVFADLVSVGTNGSGTESGLLYGTEALDSPLADEGGPNDGFLREEAGLRVVFLSDEEDQSPGTVDSYVTFLQGLKLNPDHVVLSGITGQGGCTSATGDADPAPRYEAAVSATNGLSISICAADWSDTLTDLAWASLSYQDTFALSQQPVVESIEVYVASVPLYVGWGYQPELNAVVFEQDYIPDNGDVVDIAYNRLGICEG